MPELFDAMTDPDRPVTRRAVREELEDVLKTLATKEDLKAFVTKEDLKEALKVYATKEDLEEALKVYATKEDLKEALKAYATKEDLKDLRNDLRNDFKVVAESFKEQFGNLYDWCHASFDGLDRRLTDLESRRERP